MIRTVLPLLLCGTIAGVLAWAGHTLLFHVFMLYDDEGYVLISLKNFSQHGSLYDQVYSQYGPAFYLVYDALHRLLGFPWTNTSGRWITLCNWMGTTLCCALLVRRAGGSWPLVLCVLVEVFGFLRVMEREPMHPGSTITCIVAATAWLGWEMLRAGRIDAFACVTASMGALLALMKINVGVFLGLSSVSWLALSIPTARSGRRDLALAMIGGLLPLALMRPRIHEEWAQIFAAITAISIASVVLAAAPVARVLPAGQRAWRRFLGTGLMVAAVTACTILFRGTSLAELWQGVVVGPLKHPGAYGFGPVWLPGSLWLAGVFMSIALVAHLSHERRGLPVFLAWLKIAATTACVSGFLKGNIDGFWQGLVGLNYGVPLAGLLAWPLDQRNPAVRPADQARAWLALILVFQSLHAYPVAGSQLGWGTFLCVPLMALGFEDAVRVASRTLAPSMATMVRATTIGALILLAAHLSITTVVVSGRLLVDTAQEPIGEPGAERISMPAAYSSSIRILSENVRAHGDVLFSLPGCYSFNLWTGVDTPTLANVTHWFSLLNDGQQHAIIRRLDSADRPVFIVQHAVLADAVGSGVRPQGPLMEYLLSSFHRAFAIESYSFWVRNGRSIAPLSTGTLSPAPGDSSKQLQLHLAMAPRSGKIASVELWSTVGAHEQLLVLDASQTEVTLTPLSLDGTAAGPPQAVSWPWSNDRVARVTLTFTPPSPLPPPKTIEVIFISETGAGTGTARILSPDDLESAPENVDDAANGR